RRNRGRERATRPEPCRQSSRSRGAPIYVSKALRPLSPSSVHIPVHAIQESPHHLGLFFHLHQERVVAITRRQFAESDVDIAPPQRTDNFERLIGRIEPVACKTQHQKPRGRAVER